MILCFITFYYKLDQSKHTRPSERTLQTQLTHDNIRESDTEFGSPSSHIPISGCYLFIEVLLFPAIDTLFTSLEPLIYIPRPFINGNEIGAYKIIFTSQEEGARQPASKTTRPD
jgi:hypothetical protein